MDITFKGLKCPNCKNDFHIFKSMLGDDLQLCPYCSQPFSDRRSVSERLIQLDKETRTVLATIPIYKNLELYLYFTEPVLNSSTEILNSIHTSQGSLLPIIGNSLGNSRFGFQVKDISSLAIVTVRVDSDLILSRYGAPVSPVAPVTFLYDSQRPAVKLSTTSNMRTRHKILPMLIRFMKPVFGFNSSHVSVSGGCLQGYSSR